MRIRDALAADAPAIRELATSDIDPGFLLRERTVRVADAGSGDTQNIGYTSSVAGFLAFDAMSSAVHLTRIGGDADAVDALLDDAIAFAASESLPVEAVVPGGGVASVALETRGFESSGRGPRFEGRDTHRFRLDTDS